MRDQNDVTIISGILRSVNFVNMIIDGDGLVMSLHGLLFHSDERKRGPVAIWQKLQTYEEKNWLLFLFSRCRDQKWITTFAPDTEL